MDIGICDAFHVGDIDYLVRAEELRARLHPLHGAGDQVMTLPGFRPRFAVLEGVARDAVAPLAG